MGNLLKTNVYKEASDKFSAKATSLTNRADDLAKRRKPNQKFINNAKKEATIQKNNAKALENLDNKGKVIKGTISKTGSNKMQDETKTKKNE